MRRRPERSTRHPAEGEDTCVLVDHRHFPNKPHLRRRQGHRRATHEKRYQVIREVSSALSFACRVVAEDGNGADNRKIYGVSQGGKKRGKNRVCGSI